MRRPRDNSDEGERSPALALMEPEAGVRSRLWSAVVRAIFGVALMAGLAFMMFVFAVLIFLLMRGALIPKAIHEETVFFDFAPEDPSINKPFASIDLLTTRKQWQSTNLTFTNIEPASRALTMLQEYSIQVSMRLSHSPRNYDIGKFMLYAKLRDSAGEMLASSSRPIVVRYRSPLSLTLEVILLWPLHLTGILTESQDVSVELFNNFQEGRLHPAAKVDLSLSRSDPDIEHVQLSLLPQLRGLQHFFYHYRLLSTLVFIGFVFMVEVAVLLGLIGVRFFLSFFREPEREADTVLRTHSADEGESEMGSSYYDVSPLSGADAARAAEVASSVGSVGGGGRAGAGVVSRGGFISTAVARPSLHEPGIRRRRLEGHEGSGSENGSDADEPHSSSSASDFKED